MVPETVKNVFHFLPSVKQENFTTGYIREFSQQEIFENSHRREGRNRLSFGKVEESS